MFSGGLKSAGAEARTHSARIIGPAKAVPLLQSIQHRVFPQPVMPVPFKKTPGI
jgi:hypothetical protein